MKIQVLPPDVVSQIAAGEVLDRPANLVKELVENSLDAGATEIEVEYAKGGREVSVRDNGFGIVADEMPLALQPHATSKILTTADLYSLNSFGFRGEALASVAAVSQLTMTSRRVEASTGYRLQCDFGKQEAPVEVSARLGTEMRVRELFSNVPARLKFLRSEAAEHGQIKSTLKALALANPTVGFSVRSSTSLVYHWPAGATALKRAQQVLESDALYFGESEKDGVRVEVIVGSPQDAAQVNRNMWFFAQGRWIQDRSLTAAVMESYRNLLMHGEYPAAVVKVTVPAEAIDVNVHPTKSSVKFKDPQSVFRAVNHTIRQVLEKSPWLSSSELQVTTNGGESRHPSQSAPPIQENLKFGGADFERTHYNTKVFPLAEVREALTRYSPQSAEVEIAPQMPAATPQEFRWADLQAVGQVNHTYIVAQSQEALYLVDQHAAHERVVFERLMESFRLGRIEVQNLFLPIVLDLSAAEVEALIGARPSLESMGVSLEQMGPERVAVQAIPTLASDRAVTHALTKLASDLCQQTGERVFERMLGDIFASMACHSVVRAGQALSVAEMQSLLEQMDQYPLSSFCPHGRPVFTKRKFTEIEREFGRIV